MSDTSAIARFAQPLIDEALDDTRVVAITGARQVGKSTLADVVASRRGFPSRVTLDDAATRQLALDDPTGFIAGLRLPAVIDEIQRAPDLLLAIKAHVDRDRSPGQFLLTGSANPLTAPRIVDALPGRAEYLNLFPFSQGELRGRRESFVERLLAGDLPTVRGADVGREPCLPLLTAGGFPEAVRRSPRGRIRFFEAYMTALVDRDVNSIATVSDARNVRRLLEAFAAVAGSEQNAEALGRRLGLSANTVRSYTDLLDTMFVIRRLPAWSSNRLARAVKAPKVQLADPALHLALLGAGEEQLRSDGVLFGSTLEGFVVGELERQASWQLQPPRLFHFRDRQQREVDVILERRDGGVIGIEVKASATANPRDARGLRYLQDRLGDTFVAGVVMYLGESTVPYGDRISAVPLQALWT